MNKIKLSLKGNLKVLKARKDSKRRIIAGYASIAVIDSEDQIIPTEVLAKGMECLLDDPHYANVMLVHKNIQIGKIIDTYGKYKTGVDDTGLFIICEIRNNLKTADEIWDSILDGKLNGFSIGCEVLLSHKECDDEKCVTILDEINIFEVSICSQPVNKGSGFIILSKSKYDTYKLNDVCYSSGNKEEKQMTEEKTDKIKVEQIEDPEVKSDDEKNEEEDTTEEKADVEELSVEERIESLERSINSILGTLESMAKPEPDEEEPEEEEPEEEDMEKKSDDEDEPEEETEEKSDAIHETLESILKAINDLSKEKSKEEEIGELRIALKTSNDTIKALEKKVEIMTKSEESQEEVEQKTVQDKAEDVVLEKESPYVIERGMISLRN